MNSDERKHMMYSMYHGDNDKNIISQCALLVDGKEDYMHIYDLKPCVVIDPDENISGNIDPSKRTELVLKPIFAPPRTPFQFVAGVHFTTSILCCPTKTLTEEKCSGRF